MATSRDDLNRQFRKITQELGDLRPIEWLKTPTELLEAHEALHGQWLQALGFLNQLRTAELELKLAVSDLKSHDDVNRCKEQLAAVKEMEKSFMQFQAEVLTRANNLEHRRWEIERYES